jgi:GNAT superfamily N-acetyltransferase
MRVEVMEDAAEALAAARAFLESRPVDHNLVLTLLSERAASPQPGRYAVASDDGAMVGMSFQSPLDFHTTITPMPAAAAEAVASALYGVAPDIPGVAGDAGAAAVFAGTWATLSHRPASPAEGQRLYRLDALAEPTPINGAARRATAADGDVLLAFNAGFHHELHETPPPRSVESLLSSRRLWLWDDDGHPVGMAGATTAIAGVGRVGPVYTPPEHRRRGIAAALTAVASRALLDEDATPILYTQLENPTSNAIYQRLGYVPVGEITRYTFR